VSNWPGKFVIGLTGNIATGKSVVRKMLEHLGAYGIDADGLSHRAMAKGAPGYQPVVEAFGRWVLDSEGQIDRVKLGKLVFSDAEALKQLEGIIHPLVRQAVAAMATRAAQRVIVIEAIKLLEGDLRAGCDSIWVTTASETQQVGRLVAKRGLSSEDALVRVSVQRPQEEKTAAADVVISNAGSFEDTWHQVAAAWKRVVREPEPVPPVPEKSAAGQLRVTRGRPRDSAMIAEVVTRLSAGERTASPDDVMADFGDKAFLLLQLDGKPVGVAGWQVENLVARTTEFYLDPAVPMESAFKTLIAEVESASSALQCEASLLFIPKRLAAQEAPFKQLGYDRRTPQSLGVQAWHDAALESAQADTVMFFKQLRQDRVLRPI
jgi:dephospho-CoA kinase